MKLRLTRPRTFGIVLMLCAAAYGCGEGTAPGSTTPNSTAAAGSSDAAVVADEAATTTKTLARPAPNSVTSTISNPVVIDGHSAAGHGTAGNGLTTPSVAMNPGLPQPADGRTSPVGTHLVAPTRGIAKPTDCVLDFMNSAMLEMSESTLYGDRIYIPWYQQCGSAGYVDLRSEIQSHFHLVFAAADVGFCFTHPQFYPARIDPDGTCHLVDIATEPRTYISTHGDNDRLRLRTKGPLNSDWTAFDLNRFRVVGTNPVKVCYKKKEAPANWEASEPTNQMPGSWWCWNELGQGLWDLSASAFELAEVTIEPSPGVGGSVLLDDFHVAIRN